MTFRELLGKYKDGTLTDEEKLLVEQELEKSEAINDYLAEVLEKSIGFKDNNNYEVADENNANYHDTIVKEIKKTVNIRLATVVGASVICVLIVSLLFQYIISPIVSSLYYDPTAKTSGQKYQQDLSYDLRGITEVSMPGYAISNLYHAVDKGFGKYDLLYTRRDLFTNEEVTVNAKIERNMRVGTLESFYFRTYTAFSEFWNSEEGSKEYEESLEFKKGFSKQDIEYIKKLPSTSYISAWVRFSEDLTMKELSEIKGEYNGKVNFKWIAVRTAQKQGRQLAGFSTGTNDGFYAEPVNEERYPGFQLSDAMQIITKGFQYEELVAKIYEMHFTSLLKYLVDHKEAVSALVGNTEQYDYESALSYIEENGMNTYGALVYGEANDLNELYESGTIMTFDIENIVASKCIQ